MFATRCTYHDVHEACRLMDMFVITENVMLLFLFVSFLSPFCHFTFDLFHLAAHCCFFYFCFSSSLPSSLSHTLSTVSVLFLLSSSYLYFNPVVLVLFFVPSPFLPLSSSFPTVSLLPPADCGKQETSGLSSASGCGRHGEDARAGLEVCVYVPAGVLQGSGDEGPG